MIVVVAMAVGMPALDEPAPAGTIGVCCAIALLTSSARFHPLPEKIGGSLSRSFLGKGLAALETIRVSETDSTGVGRMRSMSDGSSLRISSSASIGVLESPVKVSAMCDCSGLVGAS